jgi:predicted nucleotide-binding protein
MNNNELIEKFHELKVNTESLSYDNKSEKDKIKKRLEMLIRNKFGNDSHYLNDLLETEFYYHPLIWFAGQDLSREDRETWEEGKQKWCNLVETMIEEIQSFSSGKTLPEPKNKDNKNGQRIFVVHGHDNEMVETVARFIIKLGFEPIILREQPNQGRTIIEKFEDFSDVDFALVLFSPDDEGKSIEEEILHKRPRQNVVFELGFFIGRLGRQNVVVLHREVNDFEMLSDFQGVLFEPYREGWEFRVAKEIKAAGFEVNLNNLV